MTFETTTGERTTRNPAALDGEADRLVLGEDVAERARSRRSLRGRRAAAPSISRRRRRSVQAARTLPGTTNVRRWRLSGERRRSRARADEEVRDAADGGIVEEGDRPRRRRQARRGRSSPRRGRCLRVRRLPARDEPLYLRVADPAPAPPTTRTNGASGNAPRRRADDLERRVVRRRRREDDLVVDATKRERRRRGSPRARRPGRGAGLRMVEPRRAP